MTARLNDHLGYLTTLTLLALSSASSARGTAPEWGQWGGPSRNFMVDGKAISASWPTDGPKELWSRDLGEGYSAILVDGERIYTMYRAGDDECLIAMNAADGTTLWEHRWPAPIIKAKMDMQFGMGPHATPLIVGDRIFCAGVVSNLVCVDKNSGKPIWSHDLVNEFGGAVMNRGYSCSPIAYKETVILTCGKDEKAAPNGRAIMAFSQKDGSVVWARHDFEVSHASPILINFAGRDQVVIPSALAVVGVDANNGDELWSHPHTTQFGANIASPLFTDGNLVVVSSGYSPGGTRAIRLKQQSDGITTEEVWYSNKLRCHHGNVVRIGDRLFGSSGDFGPAFFVGLNVSDGKMTMRDRAFKKSTCLAAGDKLVILDEDGNLGLATPGDEKLEIHGKAQLLGNVAWTVPTLVGAKLYIRDRKKLIALDLG